MYTVIEEITPGSPADLNSNLRVNLLLQKIEGQPVGHLEKQAVYGLIKNYGRCDACFCKVLGEHSCSQLRAAVAVRSR